MCLLLLVIVALFGCEKRVLWTSKSGDNQLFASYNLFTGIESVKVGLQEDETIILNYSSKVEKGNLKIQVQSFDGEVIQTFDTNHKGTFSITLNKKNDVMFVVEGEGTKGSFSLQWDIIQNVTIELMYRDDAIAPKSKPRHYLDYYVKNNTNGEITLTFPAGEKMKYEMRSRKNEEEKVFTATGTMFWGDKTSDKKILTLKAGEKVIITKGRTGDIIKKGEYEILFTLITKDREITSTLPITIEM